MKGESERWREAEREKGTEVQRQRQREREKEKKDDMNSLGSHRIVPAAGPFASVKGRYVAKHWRVHGRISDCVSKSFDSFKEFTGSESVGDSESQYRQTVIEKKEGWGWGERGQ